jgi:uncharacterized membrane protein YfcA
MPTFAGITLSVQAFVFVVLFLLFVGIVKGCTGFAVGLLSVPVVVQFFPPKLALAALTLPMFLANLPLLWKGGVPVQFLTTRPEFIAAVLIGTLAGILGFATAPTVSINLLLSVYLFGFLLHQHFPTEQITRGLAPLTSSGALVGGIGGVVSGAFLTGGPIFVSYLHTTRAKKAELATTLALIFFLITGIRILTLYPLGLFGSAEILLGVGLLLPLTIGILVGINVRKHIPQRLFDTLVEVLLVLIAVQLGYKSLTTVL